MLAGTDNAYRLAKKYKLKTAFGTDILFSPGAGAAAGTAVDDSWCGGTRRPKRWPWRPARTPSCWHCPASATHIPGKLGVVEEGALADLLLVDGNPLEEHQADRGPGEELCS